MSKNVIYTVIYIRLAGKVNQYTTYNSTNTPSLDLMRSSSPCPTAPRAGAKVPRFGHPQA